MFLIDLKNRFRKIYVPRTFFYQKWPFFVDTHIGIMLKRCAIAHCSGHDNFQLRASLIDRILAVLLKTELYTRILSPHNAHFVSPLCAHVDADLAHVAKCVHILIFHTRFSLMLFSIFENDNATCLLVPKRRGLRRQNIDQYRPLKRPKLTNIAHMLMLMDRSDLNSARPPLAKPRMNKQGYNKHCNVSVVYYRRTLWRDKMRI